MDILYHHLNSTVFLTTVALLMTIISYILKSTLFCGTCCKNLALCFHYRLASQERQVGFTSNIGIVRPTLRKDLPVKNTELSEIIVEKADSTLVTTSPAPTPPSPKTDKKKESYSII